MTKNIQSGKPLYDNRDNSSATTMPPTNTSDAYNSLKKKKSLNLNRNKPSSAATNQDTLFQMPSRNNALLKAASMTGGEPQQKQSLYSLKDLNLDDLF